MNRFEARSGAEHGGVGLPENLARKMLEKSEPTFRLVDPDLLLGDVVHLEQGQPGNQARPTPEDFLDPLGSGLVLDQSQQAELSRRYRSGATLPIPGSLREETL